MYKFARFNNFLFFYRPTDFADVRVIILMFPVCGNKYI